MVYWKRFIAMNIKDCLRFVLPFMILINVGQADNLLQSTVNSTQNLRADVHDFYKEQETPVWFNNGQLTPCGQVALDVLAHAEDEGLPLQEYADIIDMVDKATKGQTDWIIAEIHLTNQFMQFIDHVRVGLLDPKHISKHIKFRSPHTIPAKFLKWALEGKSCSRLRKMGPNLPQYQKLKALLKQYRQMAHDQKDWPKITTTKTLKQGDKGPHIVQLRKILSLWGDLPKASTSDKFDANLKKAVINFQKRHTLDANGVVGQKTRERLNWGIETYIIKVITNMERLRWLPCKLGKRSIIVNVAAYEAYAMDGKKVALSTPIIVGKTSTKTPLFYAHLHNVIVNPSWGVPPGIMRRDKIPKLSRDPSYARRAGFTVTDSSGHVVDPESVNWATEGLRYHLRQRPGGRNALGHIKFDIANPYTVYLHDTPDKHLFEKTIRTFSNGCIRLKRPLDLATWVLDGTKVWPKEAIESAIKRGSTKHIKPSDQMPVYVTYVTVWVDDKDIVHFSDDAYHMDAGIVKALELGEERGESSPAS